MTGDPAAAAGAAATNLVRLDAAKRALRHGFLRWQCRLRQLAMRGDAGRPSAGMRPALLVGGEALGRATVVLNKLPAHDRTAEMRFKVRRTQDPVERWEGAVREFSAGYFQDPATFDDALTALFGGGSAVAARALAAGRCELRFEQFGQRYALPCAAARAARGEPLFEATYWHNALFNPNMPGDALVLAFRPDWALAEADPAPPG